MILAKAPLASPGNLKIKEPWKPDQKRKQRSTVADR